MDLVQKTFGRTPAEGSTAPSFNKLIWGAVAEDPLLRRGLENFANFSEFVGKHCLPPPINLPPLRP